MNVSGVMTGRCRNCRDGLIVLLAGGRRREITCHCPRGVARANPDHRTEAQLRAELLAAFHETRRPS